MYGGGEFLDGLANAALQVELVGKEDQIFDQQVDELRQRLVACSKLLGRPKLRFWGRSGIR